MLPLRAVPDRELLRVSPAGVSTRAAIQRVVAQHPVTRVEVVVADLSKQFVWSCTSHELVVARPSSELVGSALPRQYVCKARSYKRIVVWRAEEPLYTHEDVLAAAGLGDQGFTFHSLRHTFATALFERRQHPKIVQSLLGHASITQTMDTYSHLLEDIGGDAVDGLDEAFG